MFDSSTRTALAGRSYQAARRRRAELLGAIQQFEGAVAASAAGPAWREMVTSRLQALRAQLTEHIVVTEGTDGLYAELYEHAPRLARPVEGLVGEHANLLVLIDSLTARLPDPAVPATRLRDLASQLLGDLTRHRQRGADLVYEAYATDIGGET